MILVHPFNQSTFQNVWSTCSLFKKPPAHAKVL